MHPRGLESRSLKHTESTAQPHSAKPSKGIPRSQTNIHKGYRFEASPTSERPLSHISGPTSKNTAVLRAVFAYIFAT